MKTFAFIILGLISSFGFSQNSLSHLLKHYNSYNIPYISVQELAMPKTKAIILDAREIKEFNVSHIKNALFVGYSNFNIDAIQNKVSNKNKTIVVYCSLGIRSEIIANKLKKAGYKNVFNLYGGIFEWKNSNFKVYDSEGNETNKVHAFSKEWSQWLKKGIRVFN
ncbi:MAG: rhodanese-like domain-containing protein [Gelidibacter sp.]